MLEIDDNSSQGINQGLGINQEDTVHIHAIIKTGNQSRSGNKSRIYSINTCNHQDSESIKVWEQIKEIQYTYVQSSIQGISLGLGINQEDTVHINAIIKTGNQSRSGNKSRRHSTHTCNYQDRGSIKIWE